MVFCFSAVVLIATSPYIVNAESVEVEDKPIPYGLSSQSLANLLGCIMVFACAVAQGVVTVASRIM